MKQLFLKSGFTLVELLVVVSILGVLSTSAVVGFNYFGQVLQAKEVAGWAQDLVKQSELNVLRGEYEQVDIHFLENYLVMAEHKPDAELALTLGGDCMGNAIAGHNIQAGPVGGTLNKYDETGRLIEVVPLGAGNQRCADFMGAQSREWIYELKEGQDRSARIRFVHFNLGTNFSLNVGNDLYRLEIRAPYGKKNLFNGTNPADSATLDILQGTGDTGENITLEI